MIGYYVHHHGNGHLNRATSIATQLGQAVVGLSSLPAPTGNGPFSDWVRLEADDRDPDAHGHGAGGALHWAPLASPGYRRRMAQISDWLATCGPSGVVVDVSVEVTTLCRTSGFPVVVIAGAGERTDPAHVLAYRMASRIVAPWPASVYRPFGLAAHSDKTVFVGAFSRFDTCIATPAPNRRRVVVLMGTGGSTITARELNEAREATPDWHWTPLGTTARTWSDDVFAALSDADVVVTHAGQNALAEIAAARRPAVVIPAQRPFDEQLATADALASAGLATVCASWPAARDWPDLLQATQALGGERWQRWNAGNGAALAAEAVTKAFADA